MSVTLVYDATNDNVNSLPPNATYAGYVTGSGGVPWTAANLAKFPDLVRIAQSPDLGIDENVHADVLDVEALAATYADCAPWSKHELQSFAAGTRPGQRSPVIYMSASKVTDVVNTLISGGVNSGIGLFVANWNLTEATVVTELVAAAGPFPIVGVQFRNANAYDVSLFSTAWLTNRSKAASSVKSSVPPGQWLDANAWTWRAATLQGQGIDRQAHRFDYDANTGIWSRVSLSDRYQVSGPSSCLPTGRTRIIELVRITATKEAQNDRSEHPLKNHREPSRNGGPV